ncbi:hypothetical protein VVR12_01825 [Rothia sp. LK2588]|uniref:hypothetical protein n=1 Tax=Rothia sp. LK2588 TaxID=3114369 RepID=UPI0034CD3E22
MKVIRIATLSGAGLNFTLSNIEDDTAAYQGYLTDLKGWYGGVGVSGDNPQRTLGHGSFPRPSVRTGREITLEGTMVFKDEQTRSIADRFLSGQLWDGEFGDLTVQTGPETLTATVKLAGEIGHSYMGISALKVQIPLVAPDPFLYAPARLYQTYTAGSGVGLKYPAFTTKQDTSGTPVLDWGEANPLSGAFHNAGNATAYPVITVHGSFPAGFRLTSNCKTVEYPSAVFPSAPVVVDMRAGEVLVDGIDQTYRLTSRQWFDVPAGQSIQPKLEPLAPSQGWADVQISDTYI